MSNKKVAHFFMEEDKLAMFYEGKVYTQKTIVVCAFLGGIFASFYMIHKNFKTFGDERKARSTVVFSILVFLFIALTGFIPALEKVPSLLYTLFFTLLISVLTKKFQGKLIFDHINADGKSYSTGNAVGVCIISLLIIAALVVGAFVIQDFAAKN